MTTWIKLYNNIWEHKKTYILAGLLKIQEIYAAAHLIKLWTWAIDNAQDGDLTGIPVNSIAKSAGWTGKSGVFVDALIGAGWLDQSNENIHIHDWEEYSESLVRRRQYDVDRKRTEREKKRDVHKNSVERPQNVRRTSAGTSAPFPSGRAEQSRVEKSIYTRELSTSTSSSNSIESEKAAPAADLSRIISTFESEIGLVSPVVHGKIQAFIDDGIDPDLVILAIQSAALNNARSFRYVEQILNRCVRDKIFTTGQFEADALTARQKKQPKQQSKSEQTFSEPVHEDIGQFAPDPDWLKVGNDG